MGPTIHQRQNKMFAEERPISVHAVSHAYETVPTAETTGRRSSPR